MKKDLIIITTIFSLLGCSGNTMKDHNKFPQDTEEKNIKSIEDLKKKPIYNKLTEQLIDNTPDGELLQVVFDNLSQKQSADYENELETLNSWNKSKQAIYIIWTLESEVNNGGFNQFYSNSSGKFYKYLPDVLKLVGANKFSELTRRANDTFEKENSKITRHQDGTVEGFSKSYEDNPLNKFDEAFYELYKTEELSQIQVDFIRKHKIDFIDN